MALRTCTLFLVLALLLNPIIRKFKQTSLPPIAVILTDNSQSIRFGSSADSLSLYQRNARELGNRLKGDGMQVFFSGLDGSLLMDSTLQFNQKKTNLFGSVDRIAEEFDNQHLSHVFIASDGILNQGPGTISKQYPFQISTILLGDPQVRKDLILSSVKLNKVAFAGNTFPISVLVKGRKVGNIPVEVSVSEAGRVVQSKRSNLASNGLATIDFEVKATGKGVKQYQVEVRPIEGEITTKNNKKSVYIEVIDSRQKILLAAATSHPDIKAIQAALQQLDRVELTTVVGGKDSWIPNTYDLVILHQLPDKAGTFSQQTGQLLRGGQTATLQFVGTGTDLSRLKNEATPWLSIQGFGNGFDHVSGYYNNDFQRFGFDESWKQTIEALPPILSPSASYHFKSDAEVILNQRIGKANIPTPLLATAVNATPKRGIFWGEGFWLWRLNEFASNQNQNATDNLLRKTVQLLLSPDKKQRLKVYLSQSELFAEEQASFQVETYNQLFEPVFDQKIKMELIRNDGKKVNYSFFNSPSNNSFSTEALAEGSYQYKASVQMNGKTETDAGQFIVRANELELQDLEANHTLLRQLAAVSNGKCVGIASMPALVPDATQQPKPIIEFTDWDESILNQWLLLLLIVGLACAEWAIRKWNGSL